MSKTKRSKARPTYPPHLKRRVDGLRARLTGLNVDALLICNHRDIRYLTGFVGDDSWAIVARRSARVTILSDTRFQEQIAREAPHAHAVIRRGPMSEAVQKVVASRKLTRLGLQSDYVTLTQRKALAKRLGAKTLVPCNDGLLEQRSVKSSSEITAIKRALGIQQQAYLDTLAYIEPGRTEQQIAAYLEYRMRQLGADGRSFPSIVAVDANAALPHAIPSGRKVKKGSSVLIDWGARYAGYCSDLTRVVAIGKMTARMQTIYKITLEAQLAGIRAIKPGAALADVDQAARSVIHKAGYSKYFGHSLGHGIGLDIHELPTLSARSEGVLKPGQVVTVEPGIYLPGVGGVRIEDDVLVTEKGHKVLSGLPKDIGSTIIH